MNQTGIEWTGRSSNPVRAIRLDNEKNGTFFVHVSPGCKGCYAGAMNQWRGNGLAYIAQNREKVRFELNEAELATWIRSRKREMIFVCSMTDLFYEDIPEEMILSVFGAMALAPHKTFQVLTKRTVRMREILCHPETAAQVGNIAFATALRMGLKNAEEFRSSRWPLPNVWLGTSVEDQKRADERIPHLLRCPAAVRWLSCEPLLGAVDVRPWLRSEVAVMWSSEMDGNSAMQQSVGQVHYARPAGDPLLLDVARLIREEPSGRNYWLNPYADHLIHWVVVGGESGPGARPMHPEWARSLRDQCQAAGVSFFFKQWGEWLPICAYPGDTDELYHPVRAGQPEDARRECKVAWHILQLNGEQRFDFPPGAMQMFRLGKKTAGRILDGRTWDEYPEAAHV